MSMDDGYRKMMKVLNGNPDKVEPAEMDDVVLYPPLPGPVSQLPPDRHRHGRYRGGQAGGLR